MFILDCIYISVGTYGIPNLTCPRIPTYLWCLSLSLPLIVIRTFYILYYFYIYTIHTCMWYIHRYEKRRAVVILIGTQQHDNNINIVVCNCADTDDRTTLWKRETNYRRRQTDGITRYILIIYTFICNNLMPKYANKSITRLIILLLLLPTVLRINTRLYPVAADCMDFESAKQIRHILYYKV